MEGFDKALKYAKKVVHYFDYAAIEKDDLLQEFALKILSNKEKFAPIIDHKRTVFLTLKGIVSNHARKSSPHLGQQYDHPAEEICFAYMDLAAINAHIQRVINPLANIVQEYKDSGLTQRSFCKQAKISTATLHRYLNGEVHTPKRKQYWDLWLQGMNTSDIAEETGDSPHSVSSALHEVRKIARKIV